MKYRSLIKSYCSISSVCSCCHHVCKEQTYTWMLYFGTGATESYSSWSVSIAAAAWASLLTHPSSSTFVYAHTHTSLTDGRVCVENALRDRAASVSSLQRAVFLCDKQLLVSQICGQPARFHTVRRYILTVYVCLSSCLRLLIGFQLAVPHLSLGVFFVCLVLLTTVSYNSSGFRVLLFTAVYCTASGIRC